MIDVDIMRGMFGAAIVASGQTYPIKIPGRTFNPPNDQKYIELINIKNDTQSRTWGNEQSFSGTFRFVLHWPAVDDGPYPPSQILLDIKTQMHKGRIIRHGAAQIKIFDHGSIQDAIEDGAEILYPLSVPYQSFYAQA